MPNYIASNLGGIGNSGVYPNSRPQVDVAGAINSIAQAYNNTKEGVLTRALMQAQNQRANAELGLQQEQHQIALRQSGALPPEEVLGKYGSQPPAPPNPAPAAPPGPIATAVNSTIPTQAPGLITTPASAPLPSVGGLPSPGRINSLTIPAPAAAPVAPPMSASDGSVAAGPGAVPGATTPPPLSPADQAARDGWQPVGGTGPNAHWLINPARGTYAEQRESLLNQHSLLAANDAYAKEHPGASPLYTDAEIATGSRNPKAFAQLVNRAEGVRQGTLDRQQRFADLEGATDANDQPLSDVQRKAIANDPIAYRNFIQNQVNPKPVKEPQIADRLQSRIKELTGKGMSLEAANSQARLEFGETPLKEPREAADPENKAATLLYNHLLTKYIAPTTDGLGLKHPGKPVEAADAEARQEVAALYPNVVLPGGGKKQSPAGDASVQPTATDSATAKTAIARIGQQGVTLQDALNSPSLTPGVKALIRQHFGNNGHLIPSATR